MSATIDGPIIGVKGLTKRFDSRTVVSDLDLTVNRGQIYGFLGPNGSGKTTTIRMLCGLLTPDGGSGTCLGHDIRTQAEAIKRQVGYMTQKFGLYEDLSIRENLTFVARVYGLDRVKERVDAALERLGLAERARQLAGKLSGGWKQRLALAACILHEPKLLLLDEPTAGVDPKARRDFWDQIHTLAHQGLTVLVSTHYMDEAERCHEILYIAYGRLLARGTVPEVIAAAHLSAWSVELARYTGETGEIAQLSQALQHRPGIDMVAPFGAVLHVCGRDEAALDAATEAERSDPKFLWQRVAPNLEDVFIDLMTRTRDNFGDNFQ
ncbi:MAG TPA: ABC transporter ATP-binding protein [Candidatus Cybelea sp.]|nr:ABC transporter ATP-binding protein [Candidatus Cybelea sp.]